MKLLIFSILFLISFWSTGQTYRLIPARIIDLSMYSAPDRNKPKYYFDNNTATEGTPQGQFSHFYFDDGPGGQYPGRRGCRVIFDFVGSINRHDVSKKMKLDSIVCAYQSFDGGDTLFFYNLDSLYTQVSAHNRWKYIARPDSLLQPFAMMINAANGPTVVYTKVTTHAGDSMRYCMIRHNLLDHGGIFKTTPGVKEIYFMGRRTYDSTVGSYFPSTYTGPLPNRKTADFTVHKKIGQNQGQGIDDTLNINKGLIRQYWDVTYQDSSHVDNSNLLNVPIDTRQFADLSIPYMQTLKGYGAKFWFVITGASTYASSTGSQWIPVDSFGKDPEDPASYSRTGWYYFNIAAFYGNGSVPNANTNLISRNGYDNNLNVMNQIEAYNEPMARRLSSLAYGSFSSVVWDGHENTVGISGRSGMKAADSTIVFIQGGSTVPDTMVQEVQAWWFDFIREDHQFVHKRINVHDYPRTTDTLGYDPNLDEQVGSYAPTAGWLGKFTKFDSLCRSIYNIIQDTSKQVLMTEWGRSNRGTPMQNNTQAVYELSISKPIAGYLPDSLEVRAVYQLQDEILVSACNFGGYNAFFWHNVSFISNAGYAALFAHMGYGTESVHLPVKYPIYFMSECFVNAFHDWYCTDVVSAEVGGVYCAKYQHKDYPDSVGYALFLDAQTNTSTSYDLNVGRVKTGKKLTPSFSNTHSTESTQTAPAGIVSLTLTPTPVFFKFAVDHGQFLIHHGRIRWKQ